MKKSVEIGKVIYSILAADADVSVLLENKIFPLVAEDGTTYPFAVYRRSGIDAEQTKDRLICSEICDVEIVAVADDYEVSLNLASAILNALNGKSGIWKDTEITDVKFVSIFEDFSNDAYLQKITLKIFIK